MFYIYGFILASFLLFVHTCITQLFHPQICLISKTLHVVEEINL
jgi:hypothetical protein